MHELETMPRKRTEDTEEIDYDDPLLSEDIYKLFDFQDPFGVVYTEMDYFTNPNDAIRRRINALNLDPDEYKHHVAIKALMNYEVRNIRDMDVEEVSFERFQNSEYQSGRSNSDNIASEKIKGIMNKYPSFGRYKNQDNLDWISTKHRLLLLEMFEYVVENDYSPSLIESELYAMLRVMDSALGEYHVLYGKINAIYLLIRDGIRDYEGQNKFNKTELKRLGPNGLIPWQLVLRKQKELQQAFNAIGDKTSKKAKILNQDLLLLSLYCLIPPLRGEPKTLQFADNPKTNWEDRKGNLVLFEDNDVFLELHDVKKRHSYIKLDLPENLKNILKESYNLDKRDKVFYVQAGTLTNRLKTLFLPDYIVGSSVLRSSYVTYMYNKRPRINYNTKKDMARRMRTSLNMLEGNYFKIIDESNDAPVNQAPIVKKHKSKNARGFDAEDDDEEEDNQDGCVIIYERPKQRKVRPENYEEHLKKQREYYKNNKKDILEKQKIYKSANRDLKAEARARIVNRLNTQEGYASRVKDATMRKYDIKELDNGRYV